MLTTRSKKLWTWLLFEPGNHEHKACHATSLGITLRALKAPVMYNSGSRFIDIALICVKHSTCILLQSSASFLLLQIIRLVNDAYISKMICVKHSTVYIIVKIWLWLTFASLLFTLDYGNLRMFSDNVHQCL